jgi:hypothetical protein
MILDLWDKGAQIFIYIDRITRNIIQTFKSWRQSPFHNPIVSRIWTFVETFYYGMFGRRKIIEFSGDNIKHERGLVYHPSQHSRIYHRNSMVGRGKIISRSGKEHFTGMEYSTKHHDSGSMYSTNNENLSRYMVCAPTKIHQAQF